MSKKDQEFEAKLHNDKKPDLSGNNARILREKRINMKVMEEKRDKGIE